MGRHPLKSYIAPSKLFFYFWFWGFHIAIFAYGWFVLKEDYLSFADRYRYYQVTSKPLAPLNVLSYSVYISRGAGLILTFDGTFILLPMCRNLMKFLRPKLRWLPLDETIWFHRQVAYAMLIFTILHVVGHYIK